MFPIEAGANGGGCEAGIRGTDGAVGAIGAVGNVML